MFSPQSPHISAALLLLKQRFSLILLYSHNFSASLRTLMCDLWRSPLVEPLTAAAGLSQGWSVRSHQVHHHGMMLGLAEKGGGEWHKRLLSQGCSSSSRGMKLAHCCRTMGNSLALAIWKLYRCFPKLKLVFITFAAPRCHTNNIFIWAKKGVRHLDSSIGLLHRCHTNDHQPLTHSTAFWTNYPEHQHRGFPPQAGTEVFTVKFAVLGYCFHQCFLRSEVTVFLSCQVQWPILTLFMQINHLLISLLMRCLQQQIDNEDS